VKQRPHDVDAAPSILLDDDPEEIDFGLGSANQQEPGIDLVDDGEDLGEEEAEGDEQKHKVTAAGGRISDAERTFAENKAKQVANQQASHAGTIHFDHDEHKGCAVVQVPSGPGKCPKCSKACTFSQTQKIDVRAVRDYSENFMCAGRWVKTNECSCTFSPVSFEGLTICRRGPVAIGTNSNNFLVSRKAYERVEVTNVPNARAWERETKSVAQVLPAEQQPTMDRRATRSVLLAQADHSIAAAKMSMDKNCTDEVVAIAVDHSWFTANEKSGRIMFTIVGYTLNGPRVLASVFVDRPVAKRSAARRQHRDGNHRDSQRDA